MSDVKLAEVGLDLNATGSFMREYQRQMDVLMRNREHYLIAFVAETGLKPSECEIVERRESNGDLVIFARRRT